MAQWKALSQDERLAVLKRYQSGEELSDLAREVGVATTSLDRYFRALKAELRGDAPLEVKISQVVLEDNPQLPDNFEVFELLKKRPYSLEELSNKFDRSKETIRNLLQSMVDEGYVIEVENDKAAFTGKDTTRKIRSDLIPSTLADEQGQIVVFAVASDLHAGSAYSQPTNHTKFIKIAYEEYGVRHIFKPGDETTGVNGYRGQEYDMIPAFRNLGSKGAPKITEGQIWLADKYNPVLPGLKYYILGGNHDYWHVVNSGVDAVAKLCNQRDDMYFLGYDVADIPLTDRVDVRLTHPSGGLPYSFSYRLQKSVESMAFDELYRAAVEEENPRMRILLAGHLHIEVKFHRGPMMAAHVGCFEGQTNYLKRKGLYPTIGGGIFKVWLTDGGLIQRVEYTFIPFFEIMDDWQNWGIPDFLDDAVGQPDDLDTLFQINQEKIPV